MTSRNEKVYRVLVPLDPQPSTNVQGSVGQPLIGSLRASFEFLFLVYFEQSKGGWRTNFRRCIKNVDQC